MSGLFITFEGVDGSGKSTQAEFLAQYLRSRGHEVIVTREPGGCRIAEQIRALLLDPSNTDMTPQAEALLYAAARSQHAQQIIRPALAAGSTVISDRFLDSSLAYQGAGRGLGHALISQINAAGLQELRPDLTFFLDYPPQKAFERMQRLAALDRLETQDAAFFERVYQDFEQICQSDPARVRRIDVSGTKDETREKIQAVVDEFLDGQGGRH